jgi:hypothetical protein
MRSNSIPKHVYFQRKTYKDKILKKLNLTIKLCYVEFMQYNFQDFKRCFMNNPANNTNNTLFCWMFYFFRYYYKRGGS